MFLSITLSAGVKFYWKVEFSGYRQMSDGSGAEDVFQAYRLRRVFSGSAAASLREPEVAAAREASAHRFRDGFARNAFSLDGSGLMGRNHQNRPTFRV